ncbi:penicillin-binding protein 1C [Neolewinella persica]|uniref:penicillin-binding protein 1C n=1 Tax=Neolewinella persica TaxID=70998 RepID=UPI0003633218|nr:penicillin-binding protein 1C [Neolewinella persica]
MSTWKRRLRDYVRGNPKRSLVLTLSLLAFTWWLFCLPRPLFNDPLATELLSAEGELLSARIAADGQWRMQAADSISAKLKLAVVNYEDRTFRQHWGISIKGVTRAIRDNWQAGEIVSGGSTITMQVARMARGNKARTLVQKMLEAAWATRLELRYSKEEILRFWLANAPFGGNVVGVEAAARRYYARSPAELSWAEAATLAVLPNSPALIHPGRARSALRTKRDALLDDLVKAGHLSHEEAMLSKLEPLPDAPHPLPRRGDHLLERLRKGAPSGRFRSSLEAGLQMEVTELVRRHQGLLSGNQIHNVAAMVTEVASGKVVAYVGNAPDLAPAFAPDVDLITAARSPGSLLKPMLFALALENGTLAPRQLLADIPTNFNSFQPANFYRDHDGAVPAKEALARSLNIPFVYLLRDYGVPPFHAALKNYGFRQLTNSPNHYGLSLILGGGEITMEEINGWFLGMARQQRYFYERQGQYSAADFDAPLLLADTPDRPPLMNIQRASGPIGAGAGYLTLNALTALSRPDETGVAHRFSSHRRIAWKTGTSFGFRDAWAVGCTPAYVVSVWTGNADGEGRAGLVGVRAAAPLLFRIFRTLEGRAPEAPLWFEQPFDDMIETSTCDISGMLAGPECPESREWLPAKAERGRQCPFHRRIFTTADQKWQIRQNCTDEQPIVNGWFELPARQAYYYGRRHPEYVSPPPFHPDCLEAAGIAADQPMQLIYPYRKGVLSASKNWEGKTEPFFFELAHRNTSSRVFWHLNDEFIGQTQEFHTISIEVPVGKHLLTVVDDSGNRLERRFEVK